LTIVRIPTNRLICRDGPETSRSRDLSMVSSRRYVQMSRSRELTVSVSISTFQVSSPLLFSLIFRPTCDDSLLKLKALINSIEASFTICSECSRNLLSEGFLSSLITVDDYNTADRDDASQRSPIAQHRLDGLVSGGLRSRLGRQSKRLGLEG